MSANRKLSSQAKYSKAVVAPKTVLGTNHIDARDQRRRSGSLL
jgi:hypothetical protein